MITLHFSNGEAPDTPLRHKLTLGQGNEADIVLNKEGILGQHAILIKDHRGMTVAVGEPGADVYVNARKISRMAFLRPGDVLHIHTVQILLKGDITRKVEVIPDCNQEVEHVNLATKIRKIPPTVSIRGLAGLYQGQMLHLRGHSILGRDPDCDVVIDLPEVSRKHAELVTGPNGLQLRDLGSANGSFVNGNRVVYAQLQPGDQITLDEQRFLVENFHEISHVKTSAAEPKTTETEPFLRTWHWLVILLTLFLILIAGLWNS